MHPQISVTTKPLGSGTGLGGLSPAEGTPDYGRTAKGKGIGNMFSLIPELNSPKMVKHCRALDDKPEISEASLSEGFTFPPRDPPRPGQFTNIPQHGLFTKPPSSPPPEPSRYLPRSPPKDSVTGSVARASPLDLPEICLPGKPRNLDTANKHGGEAEVSQQDKNESKLFISPDITKPKDLKGPQSCSPKDANETGKTIKILSPPKLASSPTQGHRDDLFKAIDHKVVIRGQDDACHAPQKRSVKTTKSTIAQRQSTPSTCGDLELPTHRSPMRSRCQRPKESVGRLMSDNSAKGYEQRFHRRSGSSASSNISKKRSLVRELSPKPGSERKGEKRQRVAQWRNRRCQEELSEANSEEPRPGEPRPEESAMQNVAKWCNKFIQIARQRNSEYEYEIEWLKKQLGLQEKELEEAVGLLNQKESKLREIRKLHNTLVENNTRVAEEHKGLASELTSLREQLSEEKKQGKLANDKYDTYRRKLNEIIEQQGILFRQAQTYYQKTMDELREDNARRTASSDAIDEALKSSLKIREEMKKCTEEYRTQMENDVRKKDQVISELQEKLTLQEALLAQEKLFADKLRAQAEEQGVAHQCVQALEAKVDSLMAHHSIQNEQRESDAQQSTKMMSMLNLKLDSLLAGGNLVASKMLSQENLELKLAVAEKNIVKSMLPAILSLENGQRDAANAMSQLGASIGRDLDHFKGEASQMMDVLKQNKEGASMQLQELQSHIQTFDSSLRKAESSCENMGQKINVLAGSGQSNQRETASMLQDLLQRISAREIKSDDMERQLQQAHEEFTKNVEAMISEAMNKGEETTDLVRSVTTELRAIFEQGLGPEREKTTQLLQESETILKVLTAHIDEQKQLTTQTDHTSPELQATLESEREAAAQLKGKIQRLEQKAQETENLRDQWLRDVQTIDKVRSQFKVIEMRIPQVENYDKKLDRIVEISRSIQSSASYLATEKEWVQLELAGEMPKPAVPESVASCESTTIAESNGVAEIQSSIKEDATSRKVTVHSPDPGEESPSPPLTVMQEQKRRREVTQLRSILKSHALPGAVEPGGTEGYSARPQTNHGSVSQASNGSLNKPQSASAKEMVAEIRSRLLQHDWAFPTVADFERDIQLTSKKRQAPQGNPGSLESIGADHRELKKLRTEYYIE